MTLDRQSLVFPMFGNFRLRFLKSNPLLATSPLSPIRFAALAPTVALPLQTLSPVPVPRRNIVLSNTSLLPRRVLQVPSPRRNVALSNTSLLPRRILQVPSPRRNVLINTTPSQLKLIDLQPTLAFPMWRRR